MSPEERRAGWRTMIERLDENHDGKLSYDELQKMPRYARVPPAAIDSNGDGAISVDELDAYLMKRRGSAASDQ